MHSLAILAFSVAGVCLTVPAAVAGTVETPGAIGGTYSVRVTSLKEARYRNTLRQQYDFSCGSAALATLLTHHYGFRVTEDRVFEEMYARGDQAKIHREGFSLLDMKRYLQAHGFEADGFRKPLEALAKAKLPAIALIKENGYNHFIVIKGIRDGRVLVGDPSMGTRAMPQAAFEAVWQGGILFVIHNRQDIAAFNQAADWKVAPPAPLDAGLNRGMFDPLLARPGRNDF